MALMQSYVNGKVTRWWFDGRSSHCPETTEDVLDLLRQTLDGHRKSMHHRKEIFKTSSRSCEEILKVGSQDEALKGRSKPTGESNSRECDTFEQRCRHLCNISVDGSDALIHLFSESQASTPTTNYSRVQYVLQYLAFSKGRAGIAQSPALHQSKVNGIVSSVL